MIDYLFTKNYNHSKFELPFVLGSFGYEPGVSYLFGIPVDVGTGANVGNIYPTRQISTSFQAQNFKSTLNFMLGTVTLMKIIEDAIIGQQKLYQLSSESISELNNTSADVSTKNEITQAINAGYNVILHNDTINYNGWNGFGYIVLDPNTGNTSFKISGGINGVHQEITEASSFVAATALGHVDGATSTIRPDDRHLQYIKSLGKTSTQLHWVNLFVGITNILRNPDLSFSQVIGQIATVVATLQVGFWIAAAITVTATVAVGFLGSIFLIVISSVILNWLSTKIIDLLFSNKYLFMEEMTL